MPAESSPDQQPQARQSSCWSHRCRVSAAPAVLQPLSVSLPTDSPSHRREAGSQSQLTLLWSSSGPARRMSLCPDPEPLQEGPCLVAMVVTVWSGVTGLGGRHILKQAPAPGPASLSAFATVGPCGVGGMRTRHLSSCLASHMGQPCSQRSGLRVGPKLRLPTPVPTWLFPGTLQNNH